MYIHIYQGRSQGLNQPLQNIMQSFDDCVVIMTLTSLLWHRGKHEKFSVLCYLVKHATCRLAMCIVVYCTTII